MISLGWLLGSYKTSGNLSDLLGLRILQTWSAT